MVLGWLSNYFIRYVVMLADTAVAKPPLRYARALWTPVAYRIHVGV